MALFKVEHISIRGISATVPKNKECNADYPFESENEKNIYIKTTGIKERRIAPLHLSASDLCLNAAQKLLSELNWSAQDIDVLVIASQSPDYVLPATAPIIQNKLGMKTSAMCFDISIGCSGFVYGLAVLSQLLGNAVNKKGLLLCGDKSSIMLNKKDKATYPLFGDAGTATALEFNPEADPLFFEVNADGSGFEAIIINDGGARNPGKFPVITDELRIHDENLSLKLDGLKVFSFSTGKVPESIINTLRFAHKDITSPHYFILHQANKLIIDTIRRKLKLDENKFLNSIEDFGNTSSASIPLSMVVNRNLLINKKIEVLFCGFGVGLSWGTCIASIENLIICELSELG
jgi:3-oxoacyl-[acyl-carrier-protein] synthase-3